MTYRNRGLPTPVGEPHDFRAERARIEATAREAEARWRRESDAAPARFVVVALDEGTGERTTAGQFSDRFGAELEAEALNWRDPSPWISYHVEPAADRG